LVPPEFIRLIYNTQKGLKKEEAGSYLWLSGKPEEQVKQIASFAFTRESLKYQKEKIDEIKKWRGRRGSNSRPPA